MDSFSDSSKYELDSVTSTDSLHLITDEFRLRHIGTPDISNAELSNRLAYSELENERLRVDLENVHIELKARIASNQGLKDKITELYMDAQKSLQDKLHLENALKTAKNEVVAAANSSKWYQAQIHKLQASTKTLQMEIATYQRIIQQKQEVIATLSAQCKQSHQEYVVASEKFRRERQEMKKTMEELATKRQISATFSRNTVNSISPDLSTKLEATEDELRDTRIELKSLEQRLGSLEATNASLENSLAKHRDLISNMEIQTRNCEMDKDELTNRLYTIQKELEKTKSEKNTLQSTILASKQEHDQVEQAIMELKSQLTKMIARHKLLKSRNGDLESKVNLLQELKNENHILRSRSFAANSSLFKKLREAKRKIKSLEQQVDKENSTKLLYQAKIETYASLRDCLKRAVIKNKELQERLKLVSTAGGAEESIDEGYGDGCGPTFLMDLPSPPPLNQRSTRIISQVLASNKNILSPVQKGLEELARKLEKFQYGQHLELLDSGQLLSASPRNNARSVA